MIRLRLQHIGENRHEGRNEIITHLAKLKNDLIQQ